MKYEIAGTLVLVLMGPVGVDKSAVEDLLVETEGRTVGEIAWDELVRSGGVA